MFPYKSFCWAIGTTSYRTTNFNKNIEWQLQLLSEFKNMPENSNREWQDMQIDYYNFLKNKKFLTGDAQRPDKDAREKTSGLVDIGLIDNERNLTEVGHALLEMSLKNDFSSDNILEIPKDSYLYLRQMLKTVINVDGSFVRPFIIFLYAEGKLGYLTYDEFTYLLPLCIDFKTTEQIINFIKAHRNGKISLDETLIDVLMSKENYKAAFVYFNENRVTEEIICAIGMNRKSPQYDKAYCPFYELLYDVIINKQHDKIYELFEAANGIKNKPSTLWKQYLFKTSNIKAIKRDGFNALKDCALLRAKDEQEFKKIFFEQMHLFKMKSTLADYMDLNRRYFRITDVVIFADGKVELDILPKCYFNLFVDELLNIAFEQSENLYKNIPIELIASCFKVDEKILYKTLGKTIGVAVDSAEQAKKVIRDERYKRFNHLIDEKFTVPQIIDLLTKFEVRDDKAISGHITDNADIPTMFEYVLGIAWYIISERQGDILEYMNLSLEADLLPKTHAVGGGADIAYLYDKTAYFPAHCLLIEATLSDKTNQRRMEMEPVSRHLGEYILKTDDQNAYCLFISTFLNMNVISDFRNRRTYQYFNNDYSKSVTGLKILPLQTSELKRILDKGLTYNELYGIFERAYQSEVGVREWYETEIEGNLNC